MTSGAIFIDWIGIAQTHGGDLPIVGDGVRVKGQTMDMIDHEGRKFCVITPGDEGIRYTVPRAQRRGSHETSLLYRCDGSTVELSGNVGRFDRPDNVWNYDLPDTVAKASAIIARDGLPAFTSGDEYQPESVSERDAKLGLFSRWTGAVLRELHVTQNCYTGSEKLAQECMRYFGGLRAARIAKGVFGDETVVFGRLAGRGRPLHKALVIYRKAAEMLAHAKGDDEKARVKASPEYQMARDMGLVRIECKWGSHFLRDNGLRYVGGADMGKVISLFKAETGFLSDVSPDRAARIVADMPTKVRSAALHWIRGDDLRELYSRATYFRHVKALRDYGIDAAEPRAMKQDGGLDDLQRLLDNLPKFDLRELPPPEWYGLPEVERAA